MLRTAVGGLKAKGIATTVLLAEPRPAEFTALTRRMCDVPATNGDTTADVAVLTASTNVVHVEPLSVEYSMT
jgi:hypothetical protein